MDLANKMELIPAEGKQKQNIDLKRMLTDMAKLSDSDKYVHLNWNLQINFYIREFQITQLKNLVLADCDIELLEKENEEPRSKVDSLENYDSPLK